MLAEIGAADVPQILVYNKIDAPGVGRQSSETPVVASFQFRS